MKIKGLIAAIALAAVALPLQATASSVVGEWFLGQENKLSDNSAEYLFNRVLSDSGSATTLEAGDILITAFRVDTVEDLTGGGGTNDFGVGGVNYLTGLAIIELASVDIAGPTASYVWKPVSAAGLTDLTIGIAAIGTNSSPVVAAELATWQAGSVVALYDDPATNFLRVGTPAGGDDGDPTLGGADVGTGPFATEESMIQDAIGGTKILELGFNSDDDFWSAISGSNVVDILALRGIPAGSNVGTVNFALDVLYQGGAAAGLKFGLLPSFNPLNLATSLQQFVGNGNIQGLLTSTGPSNTPFDIFDDLNANFRPIPEPATIALMGLGLIGFGFARRRVNQKS